MRRKNTITRTISLKRKIINALLLVMMVVIAVGIYYNIYNSRAEKVVEILATATDNYAYLEDEEFKLEAKRIENDLYEISMPENINGKNVLEVLDITLENGNIMNAEIINSQAEYQADEEASEDTLEGELNTDTNKDEESEETPEESNTEQEQPTQPEQTITPEETPQEPEQPKQENTETSDQTQNGEQNTENTTTPEQPAQPEQEIPQKTEQIENETTPEEPTQTEPENTETPEQTTPEDEKIQIVDGKIKLTKEQIANNKIILQVKYDVAILEKVEQEGETVYNKNFLSEKTEEERNSIEIKEETEVVYGKTLKFEDEAKRKLVELKGYLPINAEISVEEVPQEQLVEVFGDAKVDVAYDIKIVVPTEKKAIAKEDGTIIGKISEGNTFVAEDGTVIGQLTEQNTIEKEDGTIIGEIAEDGTITGELAKTGTLADELAITEQNKIKIETITENIEINPEEFGEICEVTIKDTNIETNSEVYHVKEDNTYEKVTVKETVDEEISFEATNFSVYAVMTANEGIALAATDSTAPYIIIGDYVDGAVRHYDGMNNTGNEGHSTSTSTKWKDLTGNADLSITGSHSWGTETLVTGGNTYGTAGTINPSSITNGGGLTVQIVVKCVTSDPDLVHADGGAHTTSGFDFHRETNSGFGVTIYHSDNTSTKLYEDGSYSDEDIYYNVAFTYNASTLELKLYINGQLIKSKTCSSAISFTDVLSGNDNIITINASNVARETHKANYASILMYYRPLTSDEIKQNVVAKGCSDGATDWKNVECVPVTIIDHDSGLDYMGQVQYGWSTSSSTSPTTWITKNWNITQGTSSYSFIASGTQLTSNERYYLWVKAVDVIDGVGNKIDSGTTIWDYYEIVNQTPSVVIGDYVTDGLIRHYEANNNIGYMHSSGASAWRDLSGHYQGTFSSTKPTSNTASDGTDYYTFNGSSNYVSIGRIDASGGLSLEVDMSLTTSPASNSYSMIIGNVDSGGWGLYVNSSNKVCFEIGKGGDNYNTITSSTTLSTGRLYNIVATFNGSAMALYIDGTQVATGTATTPQTAPKNETLAIIGANPSGATAGGNYTKMNLYSVRIYNRAISTTEMEQNRLAEGVREIKNGDKVAIRRTDNCSGVAGGTVYYGWSTDNRYAPSSTTTVSGGYATASGLSTGDYYLWAMPSQNTSSFVKDNIGNAINFSTAEIVSNKYFTVIKSDASLSVNPTSVTVNTNATATATITYTGDGTLSVSSGNTGIATVSLNGNTITITGKSPGNTTITVSATAGNNYNAPSNATISVTVKDSIAPTISASPASASNVKSQNVTLTVSETGGSGLSSSNSYQYYLSTSSSGVSGGSWKNYTSGTSFTIGTNLTGTYYLFVKKVKDNAGNTSSANGTIIGDYHRFGAYTFDNQGPSAPTYTAFYADGSGNYTSGNWTNKTVHTTISSTDNAVQVTEIQYSFDNGSSWSTFSFGESNGIQKSGTTSSGTEQWSLRERNDTVLLRAKDALGNYSATSTFRIRYDLTNPTISVSPTSTSSYVSSQSVTITLADTGGSTLASTTGQYYVGTSAPTSSTTWSNFTSGTPITIAPGTTGEYTLYIKPVSDKAGNKSTTSSYHSYGTYKIDKTNPTITVTPEKTTNTNANDYVKTQSVTVTASDTHSGLSTSNSYSWFLSKSTAPTAVSTTSGTYTSGTAFTIGSGLTGKYYLFVRAVNDKVGNTSTSGGTVVTVAGTKYHRYGTYNFDNSVPTFTSGEIKNVDRTGYDVYIYGVSDGEGSGINRVQFPTWTQYNGQDDINLGGVTWVTGALSSGTNQGGGTWKFRVNVSDHNYEEGLYNTHVYIYDNLGQQIGIGSGTFPQTYVDRTPPQVTTSAEIVTDGLIRNFDADNNTGDGHYNQATTWKELSQQNKLPNGYQLLSYIESTGTQYIDTGYSAPEGFISRVEYEWTDVTKSGYIVGSHNVSAPYGRNGHGNNWQGAWELGTGDSCPAGTPGPVANTKYVVEASTVKGNSYMNVDGTRVITTSDETSRCTANLLIFSNQYTLANDTTGTPSIKAKLYSLKIYSSSNVLVRDFIPCKNPSGAVGLYDTVEGKFYANSGTGSFKAGGYQVLEYIESTGSQAIKTGVIGTARWEFDIQFTNLTTRQLMGYGGSAAEYWGVQTSGNYGLSTDWNHMSIRAGGRDNIIHNYGENGAYYLNVNGTQMGVGITDVTTKEYKIFALSEDGVSYPNKAKLYGLKCIQNGVLIRDFVPCKNPDGVVGLYDRVNRVFYRNSGSGSFTAGPAVNKMLESGQYDAILTGVTWSDEYASFAGTTSSFANLGQMTFTNEFTFEATVEIPAIQSGFRSIISNQESGGIALALVDGKPTVQPHIGGEYLTLTSSTAITPNKKYHISGTYDGTTVKVYLDGALVASSTKSGTLGTQQNSTIMAIGGGPSGSSVPSENFAGKVYSARIYDQALTQAQIQKNISAEDGNKTWKQTHTVTVKLTDNYSGFGAQSFRYGWSTSSVTAPSSWTTVTPSYTAGATEVTFDVTGAGYTGKYFLWVSTPDNSPLKDLHKNEQKNIPVVTMGRIYFDNTPPTVILSKEQDNTWAGSHSVTVTISDGHSGLASGGSVKYGWARVNEDGTVAQPTEYVTVALSNANGAESVSFTASTANTVEEVPEGKYYLWIESVTHKDIAGNLTSTKKSAGTFWIDRTNPTITLNPNENKTWAKSHTVTVTLADSGSGLATGAVIKYAWSTSNTAEPLNYTAATIGSYSAGALSKSFTLTGNGYSGKYYLWIKLETFKDVAENVQTEKVVSGEFWFDNKAPTPGSLTMKLGSSTGGNYTNDTWTSQSVYIALNNGSDEHSGHKTTTYSVNGGSATTAAQILTATGTYTIVVTTTDNLGHTATSTYTVKIDKQAPTPGTLTMKLGSDSGSNYTNNTWTNQSVYIAVVNGTDAHSGHQKTEYVVTHAYEDNLNNKTTSSATSSAQTLTDEGVYEIVVTTTDNVGNTATNPTTYTIKIDKTPPTLEITANPEGPTQATSVTYTFTFSENVTGFESSDITVVKQSSEIATGLNSTLILSGSVDVPVHTGDVLNLSTNKKYLVSFDYICASGTNQFNVDLHPDNLPEYHPIATTTKQHADLIFSSTESNMSSCNLRFFDDIQEASESDITISNIKLTEIVEETKGAFTKISDSEYTLVVPNTGTYYQTVIVPDNVCIDKAGNGNVSETTINESKTVLIDRTPPIPGTLTMKLGSSTGSDYTNDSWTSQSVYIALNNGSDAHSGHKTTTYTIKKDGAIYSENQTSSQILTESGTYEITITTTDNAGNTATRTYTVKIDKEKPVTPTYEITNITPTGYDVYVYNVDDTHSGVNRVQFPTWTNANGQDDIQTDWWSNSVAKGINQGNGTWYYRVNVSDHNYEYGAYATHIYVYDNVGQSEIVGENNINVPAPYIDIDLKVNGTTYDSYEGIKVGLKVGGTDLGYVSQYLEPHKLATTWQIYGLQLNGTNITYTQSGTIPADGTQVVYNETLNKWIYKITLEFNTMTFRIAEVESVDNAIPGTLSATSYIVQKNTTFSTSGTTLTLSDRRTVVATANNGWTFKNWSPASGTVTSATTVTATFADETKPTKPTFTNSSGGNWTKQDVTITVTSTDAGSKIVNYKYSYDKNTWYDDKFTAITYSTDYVTVTSNNTWTDETNITIYAKAIDLAGNESEISDPTSIKIDRTKPTAPTFTAFYADGSGNYTSGTWTNKEVHTTISSTDTSSGVVQIQYSKDQTTWRTFEFSISEGLQQSGTNYYGTESWDLIERDDTVYFRAIDEAGNISDISSQFNIRYDLTKPTVSATEPQANYVKSQNVTMSFADALSGFTAKTGQYFLSTNGGTTKEQSGTYSLTDGAKTESKQVTFGTGLTGEYYLYIETITDKATNESNTNGTIVTISGTKYHRFGPYKFDNKAPKVENMVAVPESESTYTLIMSGIADNVDVAIQSGVKGYYVSTSATTPTESSTWVPITSNTVTYDSTTGTYTVRYGGALEVTTYYFWVIDNVGNISQVKSVTTKRIMFSVNNNEFYETFEEAIAGANSGDTVKVLKDVTDSTDGTIDKSIILNTNGKTFIKDTSGLTIEQGVTVEITGTGTIGTTLQNLITLEGNLKITNGTLEGTSTSAILNTGSGNIEVNGGTINGNIFTGGGSTTLNGGTINGNIYGGTPNENVTTSNITLNGATVNGNIYGGGNVTGKVTTANVTIKSGTVRNVYGGGTQGATVTNVNLSIQNNPTITGDVYGGGLKSDIGSNSQDGAININIAGGTIGGNVYGGSKESDVYGNITLNIGKSATGTAGNLSIGGNIYAGGSKENETTYTTETVHGTANINIDGQGYTTINIHGSIFGSGKHCAVENSNITIKNLGATKNPYEIESIQRTGTLTIDNCNLEIIGIPDSNNLNVETAFTLNNIKNLKIKNGTTLHLRRGFNKVEEFNSLVDISGTETKASVDIENDRINSSNTINRIYLYEGVNLVIAKQEYSQDTELTSFGKVNGMTFIGMYTRDRQNSTLKYDMYDPTTPRAGELFKLGSYAEGLYDATGAIEVDGFYTNVLEDIGDASSDIIPQYIDVLTNPPISQNWIIGATTYYQDVTLIAKRTKDRISEKIALDYATEDNTEYNVTLFSINSLEPGINLVDKTQIPTIAETSEKANTTFALTMKNSESGWRTDGETNFYTSLDPQIQGTTQYISDESGQVPYLDLYLYNSMNISKTSDCGLVSIILLVKQVTGSDLTQGGVFRVAVTVNIQTLFEELDDFEIDTQITPGKNFGIFTGDEIHISERSSMTVSYTVYPLGTLQSSDYRVLTSTCQLPQGTQITMIDYAQGSNPKVYYYEVPSTYTQNGGKYIYNLSDFVLMSSISGSRNYTNPNTTYKTKGYEEYRFIIDFKNINLSTDLTEESIMLEIRDNSSNTKTVPASDNEFNVYKNKNSEISIEITEDPSNLYEIIKEGHIAFEAVSYFDRKTAETADGTVVVNDTYYDEKKLGIAVSIYDSQNNKVTYNKLRGNYIMMDGQYYYPDITGITRLYLADNIVKTSKNLEFHIVGNLLKTGDYKIKVENFASDDGVYFGSTVEDQDELAIKIIDIDHGLKVEIADDARVIDTATSSTMNIKMKASDVTANTNIRVKLYKRDITYRASLAYAGIGFTEVNLQDYVTTALTSPETQGFTSSGVNEYLLAKDVAELTEIEKTLNFKNNLLTGGYKLVFELYRGDSLLGTVDRHFVVKP